MNGKTVAENYDFYKSFLEDPKNGWTLLEAVVDDTDPNIRFLAARNSHGVATINISRNISGGEAIVEISFVVKK